VNFPSPVMKVWKIVKKTLAFLGTRPCLRISSGLILLNAAGEKELEAL